LARATGVRWTAVVAGHGGNRLLLRQRKGGSAG